MAHLARQDHPAPVALQARLAPLGRRDHQALADPLAQAGLPVRPALAGLPVCLVLVGHLGHPDQAARSGRQAPLARLVHPARQAQPARQVQLAQLGLLARLAHLVRQDRQDQEVQPAQRGLAARQAQLALASLLQSETATISFVCLAESQAGLPMCKGTKE